MNPLGRHRKNTPAEYADIAKLADVVQELTHQVRQLALILDEVREELIWAVRNDKFNAAGASHRYVAEHLPAASRELHHDDPEPEQQPVTPPGNTQRSLFS